MNKLRLISHYEGYGRKDMYDNNSEVYAITDDFVMRNEYKDIPKDKKIAMLIEPRAIQPSVYDYMLEHYGEFKYVFSGDDKLLNCLPNSKPILWGWVWYTEQNPKKDKLICMISSDKEMCELHRERKRIARKYKDKIDVYGTIDGGVYTEENIHKDYMYEVVMENDIEDTWFTEKILNCFANKTIPIYLGARKIDNYFNSEGIIHCANVRDIEWWVETLLENPEKAERLYIKKLSSINENYELSKQYKSFDDWFYNEYGDLLEDMFE